MNAIQLLSLSARDNSDFLSDICTAPAKLIRIRLLLLKAETVEPIRSKNLVVEEKVKKETEKERKDFIACASRLNNYYHAVYLSYRVCGAGQAGN